MGHEYVANDSIFSDSSKTNFALGDLDPGLHIIDRIDVEVEFPHRSRTHNTSKDTGLCGRLISYLNAATHEAYNSTVVDQAVRCRSFS